MVEKGTDDLYGMKLNKGVMTVSIPKHIAVCHCSVLDLNAFERQNKAEGLGMVSEEGTSKSLKP